MKFEDRSAFGQGVLAAKTGKKESDCPYTTENIAGILMKDMWLEGYNVYMSDTFGDMKRHTLYET